MLRILKYKSRHQIADLFSQFDCRQQSWLVSDLRTKLELQTYLLEKHAYYIDESVLRASDLWKLLLKRLDPEIRLVSDAFARASLRSILEQNESTLGVGPSAAPTVFSYIDQMAAIIFHPRGTERLEEWFKSHPEASYRWKDWYLIARFCALKLLKEQGLLTNDWIVAYLQNFDQLSSVWTTPLVVDLGGEMSRTEAEILQRLSIAVDVTILQPDPDWKDEFHFLLQSYQDLESKSTKVEVLPQKNERSTGQVKVMRFSGMLAEIKNSVGQIRKWLDCGIRPEQVVIVAPDIEVAWPILQVLLKEEGIPVQKDVSQKLQSLPAVIRWLAQLRSRSGRLSSSDVEIVFYEKPESQKLRYESFRALYKSLYEEEDLKRNELVEMVLARREESHTHFLRDEFVVRALFYWNSENTDPVEIILRELLQNATTQTRWSWKEWLSYLESIAAAKEYVLIKGSRRGVGVTRLMSAHGERWTYRVFIGLTDEALRVKNRTQLSGRDYFDLAHDLGFYLDNPEQSPMDFELRVLSEGGADQDIYSFGVTDLQGSICSPTKFWMSLAGDHEHLQVPLSTRWDELQQGPEKCQRRLTLNRLQEIRIGIDRDLGKVKTEDLVGGPLPRISASSLEKFIDCPFLFAAERRFRLKDLPDIDLDIDHRTRGQLAHALFERLTQELRFDWTAEQLDQVLEQIRVEKALVFADDRLWIPLKRKHIQLGLHFLTYEKQWQKDFPKSEILAREKQFNFYLDPKTKNRYREATENCFQVSGQIDRIDGDGQGHLAIIDYKSSGAGLTAAGSWLKNNQLQLLFYMWVLENSLVEDVAGDVIAAFYYVFRDFSRKGFKIEELAGSLYAASKRRDSSASREGKELYLKEFEEILMRCLEKIDRGDIHPEPLDPMTCKACEWRRQCRAPHLM